MLVNLSIAQWSGRKLDRGVTAEVIADHKADRDAGRWNKSLVLGRALEGVKRAASDARTFHYLNTLPWSDDGSRILTAAHFMEYSGKVGEHERKFKAAADEFEIAYPALIDAAQAGLGDMFDLADYPSPGEVRSRFSFSVKFLPLPAGEDFRVELSSDDVTRIKGEIEAQVQDATAQAMRDLWRRLYDAVRHVSDKLKDGDAIFRDSLIGNVRELVDLLPALNLTGDPALISCVDEVRDKLADLDPQALRDHEFDRRAAARVADDIARKMVGYCES
jgi:hypothetical protein